MSMFSVLVLFDEKPVDAEQAIEARLAPFHAETEVAPYISMTKAELMEEAHELHAKVCSGAGKGVLEPVTIERFASDDEAELYRSALWRHDADESNTDAKGNLLSTRNPNRKLDYWHFREVFDYVGEDGVMVADALAHLVPEDIYSRAVRAFDVLVLNEEATWDERDSLRDSFPVLTQFAPDYLLERFGDGHGFARNQLDFRTYAVLTPDGEWHEPGPMGWFGVSGASPQQSREWEANYRSLVEPYKDKWGYVIICHI